MRCVRQISDGLSSGGIIMVLVLTKETRMVKAIHSWKHISKRPTGRPEIRWECDVKKDIQRLKVPNWKTFVQDRRRWKEVFEKAKTLHQEL
jgi:hypothetical protein